MVFLSIFKDAECKMTKKKIKKQVVEFPVLAIKIFLAAPKMVSYSKLAAEKKTPFFGAASDLKIYANSRSSATHLQKFYSIINYFSRNKIPFYASMEGNFPGEYIYCFRV